MKSALIIVSSFLVAAVHGSVLLKTRDSDKYQVKRKDSQNFHLQGGNGTFLINSNCSAPGKPYWVVSLRCMC